MYGDTLVTGNNMFKTMNKLTPGYLHLELFTFRHAEYNLRNLDGKLAFSKPHTNYLKRSFSYSGARKWNDLPHKAKSAGYIGFLHGKHVKQYVSIF